MALLCAVATGVNGCFAYLSGVTVKVTAVAPGGGVVVAYATAMKPEEEAAFGFECISDRRVHVKDPMVPVLGLPEFESERHQVFQSVLIWSVW